MTAGVKKESSFICYDFETVVTDLISTFRQFHKILQQLQVTFWLFSG